MNPNVYKQQPDGELEPVGFLTFNGTLENEKKFGCQFITDNPEQAQLTGVFGDRWNSITDIILNNGYVVTLR